jgi:anti-repressor protein
MAINFSPALAGSLALYDFEGAAVRVIMRTGAPWFVLADVCRVLGIGNSGNAAARVDDDEKGIHSMDTQSGVQQMVVVNQSGIYGLILTSRKAAAKRFKRWVTASVLPTIQRTGSYGPNDLQVVLNDPAALRDALLIYSGRVLALEAENATLTPRAAALDRLAGADGSLCVTGAAKVLKVRPQQLFERLRAMHWAYRRPGGQSWLGYQSKVDTGYLTHHQTTVKRADGTEKAVEQMRVTPKGVAKLAMILGSTAEDAA